MANENQAQPGRRQGASDQKIDQQQQGSRQGQKRDHREAEHHQRGWHGGSQDRDPQRE